MQEPSPSSFTISNGLLRYEGINKQWSSYVSPELVSSTRPDFTIKVIETRNSSIMLGICDWGQCSLPTGSLWESKHAVCYSGAYGYVYPGWLRQGQGFGVEDEVSLLYDGKQGKVTWAINGEAAASVCHQMLKEETGRSLRPFIEMMHNGDAIRIKNKTDSHLPPSPYYHLSENIIEYQSEQRLSTQYVFPDLIPVTKSHKFALNILRTKYRYIMIGVVADDPRVSQRRSSYNTGRALCYWGWGATYPDTHKLDKVSNDHANLRKGFQEGETVEVEVDRPNRVIRWVVAGEERAVLRGGLLEAKDVVLRPYVEMQSTYDAVRRIE